MIRYAAKGTPGAIKKTQEEATDFKAYIIEDKFNFNEFSTENYAERKRTDIAERFGEKIFWNTLIKEAFKDSEFTCASKTNQKIFITEYGSKYHRADCSYCKGRNLFQATFTQVENLGYSPCRCIEFSSNVLLEKDEMSESIKASEGTNTMTAFVDESLRDNPWK